MELKERQVKDQAQFHMRYWMIAILVFMGLQYLLSQQQTVATIPYSESGRCRTRRGKIPLSSVRPSWSSRRDR